MTKAVERIQVAIDNSKGGLTIWNKVKDVLVDVKSKIEKYEEKA